ncbi:hypothetical protein FHS85_003235 [Rhodoligotrophos appendicifer]|uniref:DUF1134 domain-containing protein n=1 Tax=Rhodoligotrophos appendicifer TaxID=987056 RepID=UPI001FEAD9C1|nr:DUF1134 domain-containing protein [Rhodoligotrophos appendicifer]
MTKSLMKSVRANSLAIIGGIAVGIGAAALSPAPAISQTTGAIHQNPAGENYTSQEIVAAGHGFFGTTTAGFAEAIERTFSDAGQPNAYIVGQEGAGAFFGGLRYGEGTMYLKNGGSYKVYWQGPSIGFDFGGNGSRVMTLVYNLSSPNQIFERFIGVEGSAYIVGGFGVNYQQNNQLKLAPIRTGVGARLGANVGYLKYTPEATWNPF